MKNEAVVQMGHLCSYGAPLEQAIRLSGARPVVIGQATSAYRYQMEAAITERTAAAVYVVSHHVVNRTYLAGVLGLGPARARAVSLENCGISVVERTGSKTAVATLNAAFHLQGVAA